MNRGIQATVRFLGQFLSAERAEETEVFMQDVMEKRAAAGEKAWWVFLSCMRHLLSAILVHQWGCLFARKTAVTWLANNANSAVTSYERSCLYRGEAALGALFGSVLVWFEDLMALDQHRPAILSTEHNYREAICVVICCAIGALAHRAYQRREFLPLALSYAILVGAVVGSLPGCALAMAMGFLGLDDDHLALIAFAYAITFAGMIFGAVFNPVRYVR